MDTERDKRVYDQTNSLLDSLEERGFQPDEFTVRFCRSIAEGIEDLSELFKFRPEEDDE